MNYISGAKNIWSKCFWNITGKWNQLILFWLFACFFFIIMMMMNKELLTENIYFSDENEKEKPEPELEARKTLNEIILNFFTFNVMI